MHKFSFIPRYYSWVAFIDVSMDVILGICPGLVFLGKSSKVLEHTVM